MIEQDDDAAEPALLEGLRVARPLGHPVTTATLLEMVGKLAARRAALEQAARMFGAADAVRQSTGAHLSPLERETLEPWLSAAREDSDESVRWAWSEGYSAPIDQRLDEALTMLDRVAEQDQPNGSDAVPVAELTRRELDVVLLVSAGMTNRELAASLGVARATADKHVSNILRKLGLASRDEARRWAIAQGLTGAP
jgi:DNA-binding CsgD family transcriptional regulator